MNLKNCEKCGKLFNYIGRDICPDCSQQEEVIFDRVRNYILKNPGCNLQEVGDNTGVSAHKILSYLREGKLAGGPTVNAELTCLSCGKTIKAGRLCEACSAELNKEFSQVNKSNQAKGDRHAMHSRE